jgi:hypothetical protein
MLQPIGWVLAAGACAVFLTISAYVGRVDISVEVMVCMAAICIASIKSRDPLVTLYKLFLFADFCVLPLWQLNAQDAIYLPLLPQQNPVVPLWFALNIAGLIVTKLVLDVAGLKVTEADVLRQARARASKTAYLFALLAVTGLALIYAKLGGYNAVVELYRERLENSVTEFDPLNGLGAVQALANTAPLWIFVCLTLRPWRSTIVKVGALLQLFVLGWLSSGVFGNRQGMLLVLIFSFFLYHDLVSPISQRTKRVMAVGVTLVAIVTMPLKFGIDYSNLSKINENFAEKRQLNLTMGPLSFLLFRDLSRFDVQVQALDAVTKPAYALPLGRSFVGAVAAIVPRAVWANRPATFVEEKTAIVKDSESSNSGETTLLFGMPGELLVNFGVSGYILAFAFPPLILILMNRIYATGKRKWIPLKVVLLPLPVLFFLFDSNVLAYYVIRWVVLFALPMAFVLRNA